MTYPWDIEVSFSSKVFSWGGDCHGRAPFPPKASVWGVTCSCPVLTEGVLLGGDLLGGA